MFVITANSYFINIIRRVFLCGFPGLVFPFTALSLIKALLPGEAAVA